MVEGSAACPLVRSSLAPGPGALIDAARRCAGRSVRISRLCHFAADL